ncbi:MAG: UvrD-helicase domain-containing protein [Phascolarctobacterium sp.]|nr:UvrD-helicase domain-containing protein [Phascolarctobacterium sp.]
MPNTVEQQLAIDTIDRNVSVSAGAGSGKTAVLKQRFLHILKKSKEEIEQARGLTGKENIYSLSTYDGVKASNIVGITFTRKAAGEIKSRIREAMLEAMNEGDVSFWRMQLEDLERAQINTIHGLCSRILRENPVEANLDPNFVIAEETDYNAFKQECIRQFLRKELASDEDNAVKALTDSMGASKLHEYLNELCKDFADILNEKDLTFAYRESIKNIPGLVDGLKSKLQYLVDERDNIAITGKGKKASTYKNLEELGSSLPTIFADLANNILESVKNALHFNARDRVKEERDIANEKVDALETCLTDKAALPLMEHWQQLVEDLHVFLQQKKQDENMLTYDDLETKAIELLAGNDELRHRYQKKYQYFMVDEFQDTNNTQCSLIYLLCGDSAEYLEGNKLFIVGDPKQSIYRFRGADVDVFTEVQEEIKDSGGINISMKTNFRSRDKILNCCNEAFDKIMGNGNSSVVFEPLDCAEFNQDFAILPELIRIDPDVPNPGELEMEEVAQKILHVVERIRDSEVYQEGDKVFGNMAILLRSMTHCNDLAQTLADFGIPYVIIDGKGFYARQEVADIINLFDIICNPWQNISFAAVLKSPYFSIDDELLVKLFLENDYVWETFDNARLEFVESLDEVEARKFLRVVQKITALIGCAQTMDINGVWEELWRTFDIDAVLSIQKNGAQKLANVKKLRKLSLEYTKENNVGLAEWLEYVKNARANDVGETNANLDAVDAVQIMTIHKSKGLEFKQVFLPFLGAKLYSDTRAIAYAKNIGLGIQLPDTKGNTLKTSVYKNIKEADKIKDREERERLLYVAMTRAEDELYMFGIPAKEGKELDEAKWFDQLWNVCSASGCVICTEVSYKEEELVDDELSDEEFLVDEEFDDDEIGDIDDEFIDEMEDDYEDFDDDIFDDMEYDTQEIEPLPSFFESGRIVFTPSALTNYLYCERQYFYKEFMGLPEFKEEVVNTDNVVAASVMGDIIHEVLEKYTHGSDLRKLFNKISYAHAPNKNVNRAWEILTAYVESALYKNIPTKQVHEREFTVEAENNLQFTGVIDCVAFNDDDTLTIIDYKTGDVPQGNEEKTGYMYQLAIYKFAAEKIFQKKVKGCELHYLQNLSKVELTDDNAFEKAVALAKELAQKTVEEEFTCNLDSCKHCNYNYLCRKE